MERILRRWLWEVAEAAKRALHPNAFFFGKTDLRTALDRLGKEGE